MRRLLAISMFLNVALVAGLCWKEDAVHAEGGARTASAGSGDANGDGALDVADAVYLLLYLFKGGSPPVPIECPECPETPLARGLPAAGQTECYDQLGANIDCGDPDFPGQEGADPAGCPAEARFADDGDGDGDGTVKDTCTGLEWQKETADVSGNGAVGDEDRLDWHGALGYCDALELGGHDDWRLPTVRELQSIVDYGRLGPAIDPAFLAQSDWYWSSTTYLLELDHAWYVRFWDGYVFVDRNAGKSWAAFVRAVRSIQPGE